ncbi:MAG TPA: hypothetical protein VE959_35630 [Bryobacteraceae bacterium]|nr:hypothetical protein [Bryobacteraceae bacterium]
MIEQWLSGADMHVFNAAELVFPHDVEQRALGYGQIARGPRSGL